MLASASVRPVAVWHDLGFSGYLVSDLGKVSGTPTADLHHRHCAGHSCVAIDQPLGSCVLFSTELLAELDAGSQQYANLHASRRGDLIDLHVDHVGADSIPMAWTYRLLPLRWRNADTPDFIDPSLQLGIWPD
jgi:hypothetical protein